MPPFLVLNSTLRRGWYWGSQDFRDKLIGLLEGKEAAATRRERKNLHGEESARRLMEDGLRHFGLREEDLKQLRGSDQRKVAIAQALSQRVSVKQQWVAGQLCMHSAANVSQQLHRFEKMHAAGKLPVEIRKWLKSVNCL